MKCNGKRKTALVTGAAGNDLGRSIALILAHEGAAVVVNDLSSADKTQTIFDHVIAQGVRLLLGRLMSSLPKRWYSFAPQQEISFPVA